MGVFKNFFINASNKQKHKPLHMEIGENLINNNAAQGILDVQRIIEPLWWSVSLYEGEEKYENDLVAFTMPQRYVFAIQWYSAEINNGGHYQFYDNPTGIVWEDALRGFEAIGSQENVNIIRETVNRIGGRPSKDHEKRQKQIEASNPIFDDLDKSYYENETGMVNLLNIYVRKNAKDFVFSGEVTVPNVVEHHKER